MPRHPSPGVRGQRHPRRVDCFDKTARGDGGGRKVTVDEYPRGTSPDRVAAAIGLRLEF
jgi:hypothetical protein